MGKGGANSGFCWWNGCLSITTWHRACMRVKYVKTLLTSFACLKISFIRKYIIATKKRYIDIYNYQCLPSHFSNDKLQCQTSLIFIPTLHSKMVLKCLDKRNVATKCFQNKIFHSTKRILILRNHNIKCTYLDKGEFWYI